MRKEANQIKTDVLLNRHSLALEKLHNDFKQRRKIRKLIMRAKQEDGENEKGDHHEDRNTVIDIQKQRDQHFKVNYIVGLYMPGIIKYWNPLTYNIHKLYYVYYSVFICINST